jgi:hypothetical protein
MSKNMGSGNYLEDMIDRELNEQAREEKRLSCGCIETCRCEEDC